MSLMFIRVLAGFLAGLAAGILIMRMAYKSKDVVKSEQSEHSKGVVSSQAS